MIITKVMEDRAWAAANACGDFGRAMIVAAIKAALEHASSDWTEKDYVAAEQAVEHYAREVALTPSWKESLRVGLSAVGYRLQPQEPGPFKLTPEEHEAREDVVLGGPNAPRAALKLVAALNRAVVTFSDWELDDEEERAVRIGENSIPESELVRKLVGIIRRRSPRRMVQKTARELGDIIFAASDIRVNPQGSAALAELVGRLEKYDEDNNLD